MNPIPDMAQEPAQEEEYKYPRRPDYESEDSHDKREYEYYNRKFDREAERLAKARKLNPEKLEKEQSKRARSRRQDWTDSRPREEREKAQSPEKREHSYSPPRDDFDIANTVYITNIDPEIPETALQDHMRLYPGYRRLRFGKTDNTIAFVEFSSGSTARRARNNLDGALVGSSTIQLKVNKGVGM
eukprot:NODE_2465_length_920_cov_123.096441_g1638_i1.p1 GENE.NODE_2465_length_920_cov_123.096441_g1638_i1~~NODE_2465_length_920_cov_123.096441_g1638_i1.p1  ORF type:complete len:186 (-),score=37.76 NODE_2465_length_920_cov_123.096441_g1638_i1:94-651(-)